MVSVTWRTCRRQPDRQGWTVNEVLLLRRDGKEDLGCQRPTFEQLLQVNGPT